MRVSIPANHNQLNKAAREALSKAGVDPDPKGLYCLQAAKEALSKGVGQKYHPEVESAVVSRMEVLESVPPQEAWDQGFLPDDPDLKEAEKETNLFRLGSRVLQAVQNKLEDQQPAGWPGTQPPTSDQIRPQQGARSSKERT